MLYNLININFIDRVMIVKYLSYSLGYRQPSTVNRQPSTVNFYFKLFKQSNHLNFYITEISETFKSLLLNFKLIYISKKLLKKS